MIVGQIRFSKHIDRTRKVKMMIRTVLHLSHVKGSYDQQADAYSIYIVSFVVIVNGKKHHQKIDFLPFMCGNLSITNENCNFLVLVISPSY